MKTIKLLILALLLNATCYSQSYYKVFKSQLLTYEYGKWVEGQTYYPDGLYVILNGNKVTINAENTKSYMTYGDSKTTEYTNHTCITWKCVDSEGRDCLFLMKSMRYVKGTVMIIEYYDYALQYFTE